MHFGPEDDAGVSSQHTQSPAPGVAIERFEPECDGDGARMNVYSNGDYVRYSDHIATLQASAAAVPVATVLEADALAEMHVALPPGTKLYTAPPPPVVEQPQGVTDAEVEAACVALGLGYHLVCAGPVKRMLEAFAQSRQASAQGGEKVEPVGEVRRGHYGGRVRNIGFQEAVLYPGANVPDGTKLYPAPPATSGMKEAPTAWVTDAMVENAAKKAGINYSMLAPSKIPLNFSALQSFANALQGEILAATPPNAALATPSPAQAEPTSLWANLRSVKAALTGELGVQTRPYLYAEKVAIDDIEFLMGAPTGAAEGAEPTDAERADADYQRKNAELWNLGRSAGK